MCTTRVLSCAVAAVLLLACPAATFGQGAPAQPVLLGVWEGFSTESRSGHRTAAPFRIEVTRQEGPLLWATDVWRPWDAAVGGFSDTTRRDALLGSLNPAGTAGTLVKEDARFSFRVVDADRIEVEFVSIRGSAPAAFYAVLRRTGLAAAAPSAAPSAVPNLAGSWRSAYRYPGATGPLESELRLDVVRQEDELIWADDIWHPVDPATGEPGGSAIKEPLIGALSPDGSRGVLAKGDAYFSLRVLDANRLEVEFSRAGGAVESATAFFQTLARDGRGGGPERGSALPPMRGVWQGESRYAQPDGVKSATFRLEVTRQEGMLLWGDDVWHPIDPATGEPGTTIRREPVVGSLRPNGQGGLLVKPGGRFSFTVLAPDRILVEFVRLRAGEQLPTAFYAVLERVPTDTRDVLIKSEVQTAVSLLQAVYAKHQRGEMSFEEARKLGADLLRELRYGSDGYFWADTTEGVNVVLYGRKDVEGRNRLEDTDATGALFVKDFLAAGKAGGGYVDYWFPKMGEAAARPKRSFTLRFEPFGWVVGSGYYR